MARTKVPNYRDTSIHWGKTQADIMRMLNVRGIVDIQFTNVSRETTARSGFEMEEGTYAIVLLFQKPENTQEVSGSIPVRIMIPNVPQNDPKSHNQLYRLLYWYLKSKFEAIDTGLVEFAEEFMAHLQITSPQGGIVRLWDQFKKGFYKAINSGEQGQTNLLPPMSKEEENV